MPVLRYFVFVGGALMALLLVVNAWLPALPAAESSQSGAADLPIIRIHSDKKWPERIVIDTTRPTIVPPAASQMAQAPQPPKTAAVQPEGQVREAFAQLRTNQSRNNSEPRRKHRTVARNRYATPRPMMVAQQPRFGFFGGNIFGNNIW